MADKIFAAGFIFKLPNEKAPEYVKGSISIKAAEAIKFIEGNVNNNGWLNLDVKVSKGGKPYVELNTYKPEKPDVIKDEPIEYPSEDMNPNEIPF